MLLAVEGGGLFSASASGFTKGLTLIFSTDNNNNKDNNRDSPMRVVPWNQYQVVVNNQQDATQLDSVKNRVSRGCASSLSCFGSSASAGIETPPSSSSSPSPCPLKVEPVRTFDVSEKGEEENISEAVDDDKNSSKEGFRLSLRSSLKRPSVAESRSLEDIKENEALSVDCSDLSGELGRRKVQWPDACGSELTQVREFEPSEMGLSDDEWESRRQRTCSCVIM